MAPPLAGVLAPVRKWNSAELPLAPTCCVGSRRRLVLSYQPRPARFASSKFSWSRTLELGGGGGGRNVGQAGEDRVHGERAPVRNELKVVLGKRREARDSARHRGADSGTGQGRSARSLANARRGAPVDGRDCEAIIVRCRM